MFKFFKHTALMSEEKQLLSVKVNIRSLQGSLHCNFLVFEILNVK